MVGSPFALLLRDRLARRCLRPSCSRPAPAASRRSRRAACRGTSSALSVAASTSRRESIQKFWFEAVVLAGRRNELPDARRRGSWTARPGCTRSRPSAAARSPWASCAPSPRSRCDTGSGGCARPSAPRSRAGRAYQLLPFLDQRAVDVGNRVARDDALPQVAAPARGSGSRSAPAAAANGSARRRRHRRRERRWRLRRGRDDDGRRVGGSACGGGAGVAQAVSSGGNAKGQGRGVGAIRFPVDGLVRSGDRSA